MKNRMVFLLIFWIFFYKNLIFKDEIWIYFSDKKPLISPLGTVDFLEEATSKHLPKYRKQNCIVQGLHTMYKNR